jgi:hypothetical protein
MFIIGDAIIDDEVGQVSFYCDLQTCKGACCCLAGGRGAPLEDDEVLEIEKAYPVVKQFLGRQSIETIETSGKYDGSPGDYATTCIDERECVFSFFEQGVAKCSFEKAYEAGLSDWRKPISCHLFPVRLRKFGKEFLRYERITECAGGRSRGESQNVKLYEFLKEPLIRKYGDAWYVKFVDYCGTHAGSDP